MSKQKLYAWYSKKAHKMCGSAIYKSPAGDKSLVSIITRSPTDHGSGWDDIEFLGEATDWEWVGRTPSEFNDMLDQPEAFSPAKLLKLINTGLGLNDKPAPEAKPCPKHYYGDSPKCTCPN